VRWGTNDGAPIPLADQNDFYRFAQRELHYVIAPGAIVSDVRGGVAENDNLIAGRRLVVQPNGDFGRPGLPFDRNDPIEQALGPQPWNPTGFRVRHFTNWPSSVEDSSFLAVNGGTAPVTSGLRLEDVPRAATQYRAGGVAFQAGISIVASS
jgi:hypothetical protein